MPKKEQAGVDMMSLGGHPADGRDLGAAAGMNDTARAGEAQVAWDDQPRGYGAAPRHQQHKQRRRSRPPPRVAPEQQVAAASTGDSARAGEAQVEQERASQGLGRAQTAALRKQERSRPRRAPRPPPLPPQLPPPPPPGAAPEQPEMPADLGDTAGTEEREGPALSDPSHTCIV